MHKEDLRPIHTQAVAFYGELLQRRVLRQPLKEGGASGRIPFDGMLTPACYADTLQCCGVLQRIRAAQQGVYVSAEPAQAAQPGAAGQRRGLADRARAALPVAFFVAQLEARQAAQCS